MAEIRRYPLVSHLRSEASSHVLSYKRGQLTRSGRGLTLWFDPDKTSIVEIPIDDRDTDFVFQVRSRDYQVVTVQGTIAWRAMRPEALADRVDFTIDLRTGRPRADPLERIASLLIGLAQYQAARYIERHDVQALLAEGAAPIGDQMSQGLAADPRLTEIGIAVVALRLAGVSPSADLARALEAPTFERAQGSADEASFARRAAAVEKERAIAQNELATRIELARRQAELIAQESENQRRTAESEAAAATIKAEAEAGRIRLLDAARTSAEAERLALLKGVDPAVLQALTLRSFAEKLTRIDTLNVTPDLTAALTGMLGSAAPPGGGQGGGGGAGQGRARQT